MLPKRYRSKPTESEAIEFTKDNLDEIKNFTNGNAHRFGVNIDKGVYYCRINTLEGITIAEEGDFIIKGVNGEFYSCKPDIFHKKYSLVG